MQPAGLPGGGADAERRMHHHHEDDAKAFRVVDPVDPFVLRHAACLFAAWLISLRRGVALYRAGVVARVFIRSSKLGPIWL
jgi:hypothetical protein